MLDVRRLRLLCGLSRLGTIAAVAQAHSYTPSAVSQQLSILETEAGVPLLERTGRRVTLTPAGRVLVRHSEVVIAALEQTSAALAALSGLSGPLRIGAFPTAVRTMLPTALVALGRDHPGLELMVTELDPVAVPAALRDRRLDVGLLQDYDVAPDPPDSTLDSVPLLEETVYVAAQQTAAQASLKDATLAGLKDAAWILATPGTLCHTMTLHVCRAAGFTPYARHHADDFATVLALVAAGLGVSLVPQLAAAQAALELSLGESAMLAVRRVNSLAAPDGVELTPLPVRRRTRIAYRQGGATHPAITAFVAAMRAAVDAGS